jgi:hypothetical protein
MQPEHAAILAVVANFRIAVGVTLECGFDLRHRVRIAARHKEVEALADHIFPVVSGSREKAVIDKNYRVVGCLCVREHHRHSCRFSGDDERAKRFPKTLDFGFGSD